MRPDTTRPKHLKKPSKSPLGVSADPQNSDVIKARQQLIDSLSNVENNVAQYDTFKTIFKEVLEEILYFQKAEYEATNGIERNLRVVNPVEGSNSLVPFDADTFATLVGNLIWIRAVKQLCLSLGVGEYVDDMVHAEIERLYRTEKSK